MDETRLDGGRMNGSVARVDDTVRRAVSSWSPTIHRLMTYVRAQGVTWVPRFRGIDPEGREILDFIEGEVGHGDPPWIRTEAILADVARAMRQWHDATSSFTWGETDSWFAPGHPPFEVIAHNDFAPYNHVFRDGRFVGAIDFDICYPASRAWDAAWTAYRYIPLTPPTEADVADGPGADRNPFDLATARTRLDAFVAAYEEAGSSSLASAGAIVAVLPARLDALADWCATHNDARMRPNGIMYRTHARWIEASSAWVEEASEQSP